MFLKRFKFRGKKFKIKMISLIHLPPNWGQMVRPLVYSIKFLIFRNCQTRGAQFSQTVSINDIRIVNICEFLSSKL